MRTDTIKRILVGIDFSEPSRAALSKAVEFTDGSRGKILALHVVEQTSLDSLADFSHLDSDEIIDDLELRLSRFAAELQPRNAVIETKLVVGHPVKHFAVTADSFDSNLIILGAWGSHGVASNHAGVTAKQIIQECHCDTLLARQPNSVVSGITACIDFSLFDKPVVSSAARLSRLEVEPLEVLHVFYPPWKREGATKNSPEVSDADFAQEYKALLQGRIENLLVEEGLALSSLKTTVLECLKHSEGILSYLSETNPAIVVLGARGSSRIESMILGRIAERIVTESETSVYIVRQLE